MLTRRSLLWAAAIGAAASVLPQMPASARGAAMKRLAAGPGFVRYALGDVEVLALSDGYVDMPPTRLRDSSGDPVRSATLAKVSLAGGKLRLSVNAFLVLDGNRRILIDTGASNAWLPTMGALLASLKAAGIEPETIDTVAITHTHEDHRSGLVAPDGTDAFPNAEHVYVPENELGLFDQDERLSRFRHKRTGVQPGLQISPSVRAVEAYGHEIGHTAFEIASGEAVLLIWGDVVHVPSIQFDQPELTWEFDANQPLARQTRERLLKDIAQRRGFVAGAHLDFPGVGSVSRSGSHYRFTPL